ncbi:tripartite tricarboxylate transporter substrate binding protein [Hominifimenecus sp. rT4P-3]|uniref:tripartite tricarboxylate transporter substrate binding protein n=1 Tax=Hominifimenecus sp. rT4P-3 TaxID=3242979 RepID=UPI003DA49825
MKMKRKVLAAAAVAVMALGLMGCSSKGEFPSENINMIVPFGSGGGTDLLARVLGDAAKEELGQSVVVTNVTGASGTVGTAQAAEAEADGYNLIFNASGPMVLQPHMMDDLRYSLASFRAVAGIASEPTCLAVKADSPYQTIEDLAAASGTVTAGHTGVGTLHHLFQVQFFEKAGLDYKLVGFEGGAKLVTGLLGGNVDVISTVVSEMYSYVDSGEIRILAVSSPERSPLYPDIPTLKEKGFDIEMSLDFFLMAPKDTPDDVMKVLEEKFGKAAQSDAVKKFLETGHIGADYRTGSEMTEKLKQDSEMFAKIIAEAGLK